MYEDRHYLPKKIANGFALFQALQLELRHEHPAPRVRLTLAILSFIKTPLFKGETRQAHFLFPLMDVETVSEAIANALYSGRGRTIYLPGIMRYVAILVRRCNILAASFPKIC